MGKWFAAVAALVLAAGCKFGAGAYHCENDAQCTSSIGPGMCEPGFGLCSFSDSSCGPGGRRFGDLAGGQSNQCVPSDAGVDAPAPPPIDALACYGTGIVRICLAAAPTLPLTIGDQTLDTSDMSMCVPTVSGGDNYCVVVGTTIDISGTLRATGSKPLVLIGSNSISITGSGGLLDASSHRVRSVGAPEGGAGADANATLCAAGMPASDRGGGAGGSFTGAGGTGGDGGSTNIGTAGMKASLPITTLRGGCPGQDGQASPGSGGHGGGAVYLIAGTRIDIGGIGISAGGEGGGGGATATTGGAGGGGGGGAGGMIGLDAPVVALTGTATLVANGGSGGEGGSSSGSTAGNGGADGTTTGAATGGKGATTTGGDGGNGSAGMAAGAGMAGTNGSSGNGTTGGGGGGGGGAGIIKLFPAGMNFGSKASPAAT